MICKATLTFTAMEEVLLEGKNFRLVDELELPEIIEFLGNYLPDSIKVSWKEKSLIFLTVSKQSKTFSSFLCKMTLKTLHDIALPYYRFGGDVFSSFLNAPKGNMQPIWNLENCPS